MWKIMKTFFAARCYMALPLQDRKYLVSLDRFIAWSPLVFRPGRARTRTPLTHSQTGPWSGSTNQNWQGGRPAWDQDKSVSDPDVDPDSKDVRVPGLGCSGMLSLGGWTEVSSSNCEVTKGLQLAQPKGFTRSGKDNATRVKRRRQG